MGVLSGSKSRKRRPAKLGPPTPDTSVYLGAYISGQHEFDFRGASSTDDAIWAEAQGRSHPHAWDTFEGVGGATHTGVMGSKRLSYVQFGLGLGYPTQGNLVALDDLLLAARGRGAFCQFDWSPGSAQALQDILADNSAARTYVQSVANVLKTVNVPVLLRPMHEMNGTWYFWGRSGGSGGSVITDAQYKTIWERIHSYFRDVFSGNGTAGSGTGAAAGTPGCTGPVSFFWCPNNWNSGIAGSVPEPISTRYPSSSTVDWVGLDFYQQGTLDNPGAVYRSPATWLAESIPALEALNKPIGIGEWGVMDSAQSPGKAQFITDFYAYVLQHPAIKAVNYFHLTGADGTDVYLDTVSGNRTAHIAAVADSHFLSNVAGSWSLGSQVPVPS